MEGIFQWCWEEIVSSIVGPSLCTVDTDGALTGNHNWSSILKMSVNWWVLLGEINWYTLEGHVLIMDAEGFGGCTIIRNDVWLFASD